MSPAPNKTLLQQRAKLLASIRAFFAERHVMEVETPLLCPYTVTDRYIESFAVPTPRGDYYLQTSPEYAMKRLLVNGSGPIYQICKAFRNEEASMHHNPEFTMLEWYRPGFSAEQLIAEIDELMQSTVHAKAAYCIDYQTAFIQTLSIDPLCCSQADLQQLIRSKDDGISEKLLASDKDSLLNYCFSQWVETEFDPEQPTVVTHFPASQAALAEINRNDPRTAKRFELYYQGLELANGFQELTDPAEQRRRFVADQHYRQAHGLRVPAIDETFLEALATGLPACSGVALGVDRLLMAANESASLPVMHY
jgi:lysyl-tRNA synthetase class 2